MPSKQVGDGARVAALEQLPLVLQYVPIRLRVRREHRGLAEHMGGEQGPVPSHPLVDEGFRVGRLVGGDELQSLAHQGEPQVARRQAVAPGASEAQEQEEDGEESRTDGNGQRPVHRGEKIGDWDIEEGVKGLEVWRCGGVFLRRGH